MKAKLLIIIGLMMTILLSGCAVDTQGTLEVNVTDHVNAIDGALITVYDQAQQQIASFKSDSQGNAQQKLDGGSYTIKVEKEGFGTYTTSFGISVGRTTTLLVQLNGSQPNGELIPEDRTSFYIQKESFNKISDATFYVCDGTITQENGQNYCHGTVLSRNLSSGSPSEIKTGDAYNIWLIIYGEKPVIKVTYPDGHESSFDCTPQTREPNNCRFAIPFDSFQTNGTYTTTITLDSGKFKGKNFTVSVDVLSLDGFNQLCSQRQNELTPTAVSLANGKTTKIYTSGNVMTLSLGNQKNFIIDQKLAQEYLKIKPDARFEELNEITLNRSFLIEFQEPSAIQRYNESYLEGIRKAGNKSLNRNELNKINQDAVEVASQQVKALKSRQSKTVESLKARGIKVDQQFQKAFNGLAVQLPSGTSTDSLKEIKTLTGVKKIYPNTPVHAILDQSVPMIHADQVWQTYNNRGEGIRVGIIDTGIDYLHTDLGSCLGTNCKVAGGYDFINRDNDPMDDMGHGTHVAGIVASDGALKGVAPKATLYGIKVLGADGSGSSDGVIAGIEWAADPNQDGDISDHLDVINLSLGGSGDSDDPISQAIDRVSDAGIVAVVAAGNEGPWNQTIGSPGAARKAITVAAATNPSSMADFSSRGPVFNNSTMVTKPDVSAPGVEICASQLPGAWNDRKCFDDEHISISGTSMATPHVAGVAALIKKMHPDWNPNQIKSAIVSTSHEINELDTLTQGSGFVDAMQALTPRILMNHSIIELGLIEEGELSADGSVEVENVSTKPQLIEVPTMMNIKVSHLNNDAVTVQDLAINPTITQACLQPGQKTMINVHVEFNELTKGVYSGNIPISVKENCEARATASTQSIPLSFAISKKFTIHTHLNPHLNNTTQPINQYQTIVLIKSDGNLLDYYQYEGPVNSSNMDQTINLTLFDDATNAKLIYLSEYFYQGSLGTNRFFRGIETIKPNSQETTINEDTFTLVDNQIENYVDSHQLETKYVDLEFKIKINGETLFSGRSFENYSPCNTWNRDYQTYQKISSSDSASALQLSVVALPKGSGLFNSSDLTVLTDFATINDNQFAIDESSLKSSTTHLTRSVPGTNRQQYGISPYDKEMTGIFTFLQEIIPGDSKQIHYNSNQNTGIRQVAWQSIQETDPIIAQDNWTDYVNYESDDLFNGKVRNVDFSWEREGLPTGEMPTETYFIQEPISFDGVEIYNGYLKPIMQTAYHNAKFDEWFWNNYPMEQVAPYRKGKITITTPNGNTIQGNGVYFTINCRTKSPYEWPVLNNCETGHYQINVDTQDLFKEGRYTHMYDVNWDGYNWISQ